MFEDLLGAYGGRLVIAIVGVAVGLLLLVAVLWMIRGRNGPSPFVRGGKNRQPRLQVLDAAAVDTRRRLVLVRRDDVEHLVMIGGPTDLVIESGITTRPDSLSALTQTRFVSAGISAAAPEMEARAEPRRASQPPVAPPPRERPSPSSLAKPPAAGSPPVVEPLQVAQAVAAPPKPEAPVRDTPTMKPEPSQTILAPSAAPGFQTVAEKPKQLGRDFEKILEEEMAHNLAARANSGLTGQDRRTSPRDPSAPPVPGATKERSLEADVARIFGEMSATREK